MNRQVTKHGEDTLVTTSYTYHEPTDTTTTGQIASLGIDSAGYDVTYSYTYDDNGNILSVTAGANETSYVYDSVGQLVRENNQAADKTWVWVYDNAGNILSRSEYGYTKESLEDVTPTDTVNYTYGDDDWGDLLTAYDGVTISYDEIGNPLTDGEWTYTWEHGRELASMTDGTTTWTYTYNADGLRTQRTNGTATYKYIYNGSSLVQMTVGNDTLYFTDDTVTYNNTVYYYVKNIQGDVVAILDTDGDAVVEYSYDAWGNILTVSGSMSETLGEVNPLTYRGYVYDHETTLYYLQSRYYDPELGRFVNADAFVSTGKGAVGFNMFTYCLNQPVSNSDSLGTSSDNTDEDDDDDDFKVVGAGIQIDLSASLGLISGGGGAEVILFWDTEECADKGGPIVAVYLYGDVALVADTDAILKQIGPIIELLTESADLLKMDGANAIEAVLATSKIEFSFTVSGFAVKGNSQFRNTMDYTGGFETASVAFGSIKGGKAWSDCCVTYSLGYTNSFGPLKFKINLLPAISRGKAYYVQVYSSNQ